MFAQSLKSLSVDGLYLVLQDVQKRLGDAYMSSNDPYMVQQKQYAELIAQELNGRLK
ncbi:DUF6877 family protein [Priestia megaterium]|uniref:DUF6877 family protein n=1 Tax=Priestia megaterium TaxID=1404 RepID=UPI002E1CEB97|nr:DUF6877 family protein [Priestia megaterium]MED3932929.1 hypothetical protein [Priestia megaterium]